MLPVPSICELSVLLEWAFGDLAALQSFLKYPLKHISASNPNKTHPFAELDFGGTLHFGLSLVSHVELVGNCSPSPGIVSHQGATLVNISILPTP